MESIELPRAAEIYARRKLHRVLSYCIYCRFDSSCETKSQFGANPVIPQPSVFRFHFRLRHPNDR